MKASTLRIYCSKNERFIFLRAKRKRSAGKFAPDFGGRGLKWGDGHDVRQFLVSVMGQFFIKTFSAYVGIVFQIRIHEAIWLHHVYAQGHSSIFITIV